MNNLVTAEQFELAVGCPPVDDDLERCNCDKPGHFGHWACGWDMRRGMPNFVPGTAKNARYRLLEDRYEKVFIVPTGNCRSHTTVVNFTGREFVVHNSELMNPFNRILSHHHPHQE